MQNKVAGNSSTRSHEHQQTYLPLEPNRAMALTMNFPQHSLPAEPTMVVAENDPKHGSLSAPHKHSSHLINDPQACLDCISTMFGPTYAPFAAFGMIISPIEDLKNKYEFH